MAPHSSTLAWKIPWMEEPGRLQSMGSLRVGYDWTTSLSLFTLEKEVATHSSVLAWRIPGTGEPGGLPSMGSHRVGHDWSDLAAAAYPVLSLGYSSHPRPDPISCFVARFLTNSTCYPSSPSKGLKISNPHLFMSQTQLTLSDKLISADI